MTKDDLRLLPTESLKQYVEGNNAFDHALMEFAYEVLREERSYLFPEGEERRIRDEIYSKKSRLEKPSPGLTTVSLFSKNNIILASVVFTPIVGAMLLYYNLRKTGLDKWRNIGLIMLYVALTFILIVCFNVVYHTFLENYIKDLLDSAYLDMRYSAMTFKMAFKTVLNLLFIDFLWAGFFPNDSGYKYRDITSLIIICSVIYLLFMLL